MKMSRDEREFRLVNIVKRDKQMAGKFWYSKEQRGMHDKKGQPRFFCSIDGAIKEYTEMIDIEMLIENPLDQCPFEDAKYLGEGFFSHRIDSNRM